MENETRKVYKVFEFLSKKATEKTIVYYSDLAEKFGGIPRNYSPGLNIIKNFCIEEEYPTLNDLVINQNLKNHQEYLENEKRDFLESIHGIFKHTYDLNEFDEFLNTKDDVKKMLLEKQNRACNGCKRNTLENRDFVVDHIIPRARGGSNEEENLQLLCWSCNSIKSDRDMEYLVKELEKYK